MASIAAIAIIAALSLSPSIATLVTASIRIMLISQFVGLVANE